MSTVYLSGSVFQVCHRSSPPKEEQADSHHQHVQVPPLTCIRARVDSSASLTGSGGVFQEAFQRSGLLT